MEGVAGDRAKKPSKSHAREGKGGNRAVLYYQLALRLWQQKTIRRQVQKLTLEPSYPVLGMN